MKTALFKKPSAFLPILMSLIVFGVGFTEGISTGFSRQRDEGTAAHIFQILMPLQLPIIIYFATKYYPQNPKPALLVLVLQIVAALFVLAPVFFLKS